MSSGLWLDAATQMAEAHAAADLPEGAHRELAIAALRAVRIRAPELERATADGARAILQMVGDGDWSQARRTYLARTADIGELLSAAEEAIQRAKNATAARVAHEAAADETWDAILETLQEVGQAALEVGIPYLIRVISGLVPPAPG